MKKKLGILLKARRLRGCLSTLTLSILTLSRMTLSKVSFSDILRNVYPFGSF